MSAERHHYLPESYLINFAESEVNRLLRVFHFDVRQWNKQPITTRGIGWKRYLYSTPGEKGKAPSDEYEVNFFSKLDNESAPALKKASTHEGCESLTEAERLQIARCVSYIFSRNPQTIEVIRDGITRATMRAFFDEVDLRLADKLQNDQGDRDARLHFNPEILESMAKRAEPRAEALAKLKWRFVKTVPNRPFVTSDFPIFVDNKGDFSLYDIRRIANAGWSRVQKDSRRRQSCGC